MKQILARYWPFLRLQTNIQETTSSKRILPALNRCE